MSPPQAPPNLRKRAGARLSQLGKWVGVSSLIGFISGVAAVAFDRLMELMASLYTHAIGTHAEGLGDAGSRGWWILVLLPVGGLIVGWLTESFAPEARGHGTERMVRCFHLLGGKVRRRVIALKAITSAITIGTGGSAGSEGPVTQMGSGIGSALSDILGFTQRDRRLFLLAGSSAGVGALFSAPLGGALFAPEVLYRKSEFEGEAIIPCIISSIIAYTTFNTIEGDHRAVTVTNAVKEQLALHDPRELLLYIVLALLCTAVSWFYVSVFKGTEDLFHKRLARIPAVLRPALGGLGMAALALSMAPLTGTQGVLFGGYGLMNATFVAAMPIALLALMIPAKILGTSLTIATGGSGGVFAPSLAVGAMCGALVGQWGADAFPGLGIHPACYALVGMGGFFAGLAKTPIASIVIVCEMTGSYGLLAPLMLVAVLHVLFAQRWTIYETQVNGLVDSPAHASDFVINVLDDLRVDDLMERARPAEPVSETTTLRDALEFIANARGYYFPVIDAKGETVGIFSLSDVRRIFRETEVADLVIVRDFMVEHVVSVKPGDTLSRVMNKMNVHGLHEIPVIDPEQPRVVKAMLTRHLINQAYQERVEELRSEAAPSLS